jgi:hypothetical protein
MKESNILTEQPAPLQRVSFGYCRHGTWLIARSRGATAWSVYWVGDRYAFDVFSTELQQHIRPAGKRGHREFAQRTFRLFTLPAGNFIVARRPAGGSELFQVFPADQGSLKQR